MAKPSNVVVMAGAPEWLGPSPGCPPPGSSGAVAGAIKASQDYSSGLMLAVYESGAGRFILNTLLIRENLGSNPAAERLLRNLLNYAQTLEK